MRYKRLQTAAPDARAHASGAPADAVAQRFPLVKQGGIAARFAQIAAGDAAVRHADLDFGRAGAITATDAAICSARRATLGGAADIIPTAIRTARMPFRTDADPLDTAPGGATTAGDLLCPDRIGRIGRGRLSCPHRRERETQHEKQDGHLTD